MATLLRYLPDQLRQELLNAQNQEGNTALHLAAFNNNEDIVLLLLNEPLIKPQIKNEENKIPVEMTNDREIIKAFSAIDRERFPMLIIEKNSVASDPAEQLNQQFPQLINDKLNLPPSSRPSALNERTDSERLRLSPRVLNTPEDIKKFLKWISLQKQDPTRLQQFDKQFYDLCHRIIFSESEEIKRALLDLDGKTLHHVLETSSECVQKKNENVLKQQTGFSDKITLLFLNNNVIIPQPPLAFPAFDGIDIYTQIIRLY